VLTLRNRQPLNRHGAQPPLQAPRWLGLLLVVVSGVAIGLATLQPAPEMAERVARTPVTCLVCGELGGTDVVLNLLLFAPFAVGLALLNVRTRRIFLIVAVISLSIETIQGAWLPGRDASLSDLLTNSTGAMLAAWLAHRRAAILLPDRRRAGWLTVAGLAAWVGLETTAAWSLQPALPETTYWGQWAPDLGFLGQFTGTVQRAEVAGDSLPPHRLADSRRLRERLLQSGGPVRATAITGDPPGNLAPIVSVFDGQSTEIFLLGQRRTDAFFRQRTRVSSLRLRPPAIIVASVLPSMPGQPLALTASYTRGRYRLRVETGGEATERFLDASPNWAWSYFMPVANYALGNKVGWLTALWVSGLLIPIGYWAGRTGSSRSLAGASAVVALTFALLPRFFDLPPVHLSEWVAAATGLSLGLVLARCSGGEGPSQSGQAGISSTPSVTE
jgi:hypothetical protein